METADDRSVAELLELAYRRAMTGDLDGATTALTQAREFRPLRQGSAESMEVMLLEGVILRSRGDLGLARDRLRRVIALAPLVPNSNAPAEAWGWLSVMDYSVGDVEAAADALVRACAGPERAPPRTVLRAAVSAAILCQCAGLVPAAQAWLGTAREMAPRCGVPALMWLVVRALAATRASEAVIHHHRTPLSDAEARALLLQVQSAINYDAARGHAVRETVHDIMMAIALRINKRPAEALTLLEQTQARGGSKLTADDRIALRSEAIACRLLLDAGYTDPQEVEFLLARQQDTTDPGERADLLFLLAELIRRQGGSAEEIADNWVQQADTSLDVYQRRLAELAANLHERGLTTVPPAWRTPESPP
jgi:hypothetical protein